MCSRRRFGDFCTRVFHSRDRKSPSFDESPRPKARWEGWGIVSIDASRTTSIVVCARSSIVDRRSRDARADRRVARSNASLARGGADDRAEGSRWVVFVLRRRREDDGRWTRETHARARERRGGVRWNDEPGADAAARARGCSPRTEERGTRDARVDVGDRAGRDRVDGDDGGRGGGTGDRGGRGAGGDGGERGGRIDAQRRHARGAGGLRGREHWSGCESVVDRGGGAAPLSIAQQICEN